MSRSHSQMTVIHKTCGTRVSLGQVKPSGWYGFCSVCRVSLHTKNNRLSKGGH